jgi:hypothetical protein
VRRSAIGEATASPVVRRGRRSGAFRNHMTPSRVVAREQQRRWRLQASRRSTRLAVGFGVESHRAPRRIYPRIWVPRSRRAPGFDRGQPITRNSAAVNSPPGTCSVPPLARSYVRRRAAAGRSFLVQTEAWPSRSTLFGRTMSRAGNQTYLLVSIGGALSCCALC